MISPAPSLSNPKVSCHHGPVIIQAVTSRKKRHSLLPAPKTASNSRVVCLNSVAGIIKERPVLKDVTACNTRRAPPPYTSLPSGVGRIRERKDAIVSKKSGSHFPLNPFIIANDRMDGNSVKPSRRIRNSTAHTPRPTSVTPSKPPPVANALITARRTAPLNFCSHPPPSSRLLPSLPVHRDKAPLKSILKNATPLNTCAFVDDLYTEARAVSKEKEEIEEKKWEAVASGTRSTADAEIRKAFPALVQELNYSLTMPAATHSSFSSIVASYSSSTNHTASHRSISTMIGTVRVPEDVEDTRMAFPAFLQELDHSFNIAFTTYPSLDSLGTSYLSTKYITARQSVSCIPFLASSDSISIALPTIGSAHPSDAALSTVAIAHHASLLARSPSFEALELARSCSWVTLDPTTPDDGLQTNNGVIQSTVDSICVSAEDSARFEEVESTGNSMWIQSATSDSSCNDNGSDEDPHADSDYDDPFYWDAYMASAAPRSDSLAIYTSSAGIALSTFPLDPIAPTSLTLSASLRRASSTRNLKKSVAHKTVRKQKSIPYTIREMPQIMLIVRHQLDEIATEVTRMRPVVEGVSVPVHVPRIIVTEPNADEMPIDSVAEVKVTARVATSSHCNTSSSSSSLSSGSFTSSLCSMCPVPDSSHVTTSSSSHITTQCTPPAHPDSPSLSEFFSNASTSLSNEASMNTIDQLLLQLDCGSFDQARLEQWSKGPVPSRGMCGDNLDDDSQHPTGLPVWTALEKEKWKAQEDEYDMDDASSESCQERFGARSLGSTTSHSDKPDVGCYIYWPTSAPEFLEGNSTSLIVQPAFGYHSHLHQVVQTRRASPGIVETSARFRTAIFPLLSTQASGPPDAYFNDAIRTTNQDIRSFSYTTEKMCLDIVADHTNVASVQGRGKGFYSRFRWRKQRVSTQKVVVQAARTLLTSSDHSNRPKQSSITSSFRQLFQRRSGSSASSISDNGKFAVNERLTFYDLVSRTQGGKQKMSKLAKLRSILRISK